MKYIFLILRWFFGIIFSLLAVSTMLLGNWIQLLPVVIIVLLLLLPVGKLSYRFTGMHFPWWGRLVSSILLLAVFVWLGSFTTYTSAIYKSPEAKQRFMEIYAKKMETWPTSYKDIFINTEYGVVHAIVSGPKQAPPLVLLHVSGVPAWSWQYNVGELRKHYRVYAFDTIGDAGKSELTNRDHYPQEGRAQAALYSELFDKLGIESASVVGGSEGGFIGTNIALFAPERVKKLVLLGPMGFGGTTASVLRIMLIQFFPLKSIQNGTVLWAFGDNPGVVKAAGEWFRLVMTETFPRKARPVTFSTTQLQSLKVPVLLVLGKKDNLIGDPGNTRLLAQNIPNVRIKVLNTGHFIGLEQPQRVNRLILKFLGEK